MTCKWFHYTTEFVSTATKALSNLRHNSHHSPCFNEVSSIRFLHIHGISSSSLFCFWNTDFYLLQWKIIFCHLNKNRTTKNFLNDTEKKPSYYNQIHYKYVSQVTFFLSLALLVVAKQHQQMMSLFLSVCSTLNFSRSYFSKCHRFNY